MKSNRLTVVVVKQIAEVYAFTADLKNVPKWQDGVAAVDKDQQLGAGSVWRFHYKDGRVVDFDEVASKVNDTFEIVSRDGNHHVRYSFKPLNSYKTEMEYFEWVEEGCLKSEYRQSNAAKCGVSV